MANEITVREEAPLASPAYEMMPVEQIMHQTEQVKALMASCMEDGLHYGKIPGCGNKPTLLQPGAQQLTLMFGLADTYEVSQVDLPNGHREYTVTCALVSKSTGLVQGSGMGLCSTMESKYRYRNVADYEVTGQPIPSDASERKREYRKQGFGMKKVDGIWEWVRYKDSGKQENPDIADTYNTVLKMACKRALIAATLNTLAVSSLFTQDIEDLESHAIQTDPEHPDPRKELWERAGQLKREAVSLGISEDGITAWMDSHVLNGDGRPKPKSHYTQEDIQALCDFVSGLIQDKRSLVDEPMVDPAEAAEAVQAKLLPKDVVF